MYNSGFNKFEDKKSYGCNVGTYTTSLFDIIVRENDNMF